MKKLPKTPSLPSKAELLAFIAERPGKSGTREIARAFNLKNHLRADLKRLLRELADEGRIETRRKKVHQAGGLPDTILADVTGRDSGGDLIATPDDWDEEKNGAAPKILIHTPRKTHPRDAGGVGDRVLLRIEPTDDEDSFKYRGRVIRVLEKPKQRVLGIFHAAPGGGGRIEPVEKKQIGKTLTIAPHADGGAQDGDLVAVEVSKPVRLGPPQGKITERLGSLKSEKAVSMIAIASHSIPAVFRKDTLAEAEEAKPATMKGREDWRDLALVTIDPADAKDHDDAVHAAPDEAADNTGGFVLTVAIADVAYYVTPGSALDREALVRGNSTYFPDRVVPMLPERISNDLCSLRPQVERPALAVRMVIGADGRKRSHTFHRIMMRSAARLSYQQAQAAIDGRPDDTTGPLLDRVLKPLYAAYDALKLARTERAPLDLDLPERKIMLKPDGTVDRVATPERLDAHKLIEEFMILANVTAAETLERARTPLIYRVHDEPGMEKIVALREFLATLDIPFAKAGALRPQAFNGVLARVKGKDAEQLVNEVVLRSQSQAEYASENYGHFGLNLRRYAHFTSPIRRYADLIVHRALIRALKLGDDGLPDSTDAAALAEVSTQISTTERRSMLAERETNDRLIANFLADRIGATFEGRISGVTRAGLFVKLRDTGADGFIPARTIGDDYFHFDERRHAMIGRRSGEIYRLGDSVIVKLIEAAPVAGALRFSLVSEGSFDGSRRPSYQDTKPHQRRGKERGGSKHPRKKKHKHKGKRKAS